MIFWNSGSTETTIGQNILGIRILDQNLELAWMGGITTVSFRARYLSLLPWLLGAFTLETGTGAEKEWRFDRKHFFEALRRMELVVLASSKLSAENLSESTTGILNSLNYRDILLEIQQQGQFSGQLTKGGSSLDVYSSPARSFGLLADDPDGAFPFRVVPSGKEIHDCRERALNESPLRGYILWGGVVTREIIDDHGIWFSVNGLNHPTCADERALLEKALFTPSPFGQPLEGYEQFRATVHWALEQIVEQPANADALIDHNFQKAITDDSHRTEPVYCAWQEYELRRRIHFAQELLLACLVETLHDQGPMSVADVISVLTTDSPIPPILASIFGGVQFQWDQVLNDFPSNLRQEDWWHPPISHAQARALSPSMKAVYSIALIVMTRQQVLSRRVEFLKRLKGAPKDPNIDWIIEKLFLCHEQSLRSVLGMVLEKLVIQPHLTTTLNKMGEGQKCSLRFYVEDGLLYPTDLYVEAGCSGTRLYSLLSIMADIGLLRSVQNGYEITERGKSILQTGEFTR